MKKPADETMPEVKPFPQPKTIYRCDGCGHLSSPSKCCLDWEVHPYTRTDTISPALDKDAVREDTLPPLDDTCMCGSECGGAEGHDFVSMKDYFADPALVAARNVLSNMPKLCAYHDEYGDNFKFEQYQKDMQTWSIEAAKVRALLHTALSAKPDADIIGKMEVPQDVLRAAVDMMQALSANVQVLLNVIDDPNGGSAMAKMIVIETAKDTVKDADQCIALVKKITEG